MPDATVPSSETTTSISTVNGQVTDAVIHKQGVISNVLSTCHAVVNDIDDKIVAIVVLGSISIAAMYLKLEGAKDVILTAVGGIGGLALGRRANGNGYSNGNGNSNGNGTK